MKREEGFYWINWRDGVNQVAYWGGRCWWVTAMNSSIPDIDVLVLSAKLTPPES